MRFFSTELLFIASVILAPATAAPTAAEEGTVSVQFARDLINAAISVAHDTADEHKLTRRDCAGVYTSNQQCVQQESLKCLHCSSEPPKESLTCLNSCFADNAEFCGKLCP
ncbi:hypothetical protein GTA08_BOTSDO07514 [Neofusicoccum parvum]|uniref:Uncharacterized protein n=1 Tax=Neofusicoccum parvum TaxID=310453 RepID=A0ACB5SD69_9PEZI|nr:hypothetical protein GTA08_BOTSDO07514 [Neofusicoccum parvum]GME65120.1 hypothetical protein GTA08_BOTSDO07514 [Neofusicoccum parvum]